MANKKKNKYKNNKNNIRSKTELKPITKNMDLLYMTTAEIRAKDMANLFQENEKCKVELWDEMNVLELELPNTNYVDFESLEVNFSDLALLENMNIQTAFAIRLKEEDYSTALLYFKQIQEAFGGFICADTEDFSPIYVGTLDQA
jgi:hypothetical protein